jgi:hypothetical protein
LCVTADLLGAIREYVRLSHRDRSRKEIIRVLPERIVLIDESRSEHTGDIAAHLCYGIL